ncbi:hypothetical protein D3C81_1417300 [compost metagenome]
MSYIGRDIRHAAQQRHALLIRLARYIAVIEEAADFHAQIRIFINAFRQLDAQFIDTHQHHRPDAGATQAGAGFLQDDLRRQQNRRRQQQPDHDFLLREQGSKARDITKEKQQYDHRAPHQQYRLQLSEEIGGGNIAPRIAPAEYGRADEESQDRQHHMLRAETMPGQHAHQIQQPDRNQGIKQAAVKITRGNIRRIFDLADVRIHSVY